MQVTVSIVELLFILVSTLVVGFGLGLVPKFILKMSMVAFIKSHLDLLHQEILRLEQETTTKCLEMQQIAQEKSLALYHQALRDAKQRADHTPPSHFN
jgi:hypothetical protein